MPSYRRILVEGPECSGKSMLVERLKNSLKWDAKSLHHRQGDQFERYLKEYMQEYTIFDRGHISESVYGTLWRKGSPFTEEERLILDQFCKLKTVIIFACAPLPIMRSRYCKRDFVQQIKLEELENSRNLFLEAFKELPHISYVSESLQELDGLISEVRGLINETVCTANREGM